MSTIGRSASYHKLLFAAREVMNYDSVYENALDELSGKVDLSWVKSCVAMGTGDGQREFQFARRFLPNLRTLIAVEPDHESVLAFRTSVKNGDLPRVEATATEMSIQHWSGVNTPVDLVLLFDFLYHVDAADRQALFQRLFTQCVTPGGVVIIIAACYGPNVGYMLLRERLGKPAKAYYDELEKEMLSAGFVLAYTQDMKGPDDFTNPSDELVKMIQIDTYNVASEQEICAGIVDIFGSMKSHYHKKWAIFQK